MPLSFQEFWIHIWPSQPLSLSDLVNFWYFALATLMTPGPNNTLLMNSGMRFGIKRTLPHMFGIIFGFFFLFLMIGFLIAFLNEDILRFLRYISIVLISYLAFKIATTPISMTGEANTQSKPWRFYHAFFFQWINPKALMMSFAGLTAYQIGALPGALIYAFSSLIIIMWVVAGAVVRHYAEHNPFIMRMIYILMAVGLIATLFF